MYHLQPYVLYRSYSYCISHTSGTGRKFHVPNSVHTSDHISPMIHKLYATLCCVLQPYVLYRYISHTSGTGRKFHVPNSVHTSDHISPMIHKLYATICCVLQPYVLYRSYSYCISHTSGTGRKFHVPNSVHTSDHISPMIHKLYATLCCVSHTSCTGTLAIRLVQVVNIMYQTRCIHQTIYHR